MQHVALLLAGMIGGATAIFHGVVTHRLMVRPIDRRLVGAPGVSMTIRRIVPPVLHYSTYSWLVGGIALIVVAYSAQPDARRAISLLVGSMFLYGAVANLWATRGRHPGWLLLAVAVALIAVDMLS